MSRSAYFVASHDYNRLRDNSLTEFDHRITVSSLLQFLLLHRTRETIAFPPLTFLLKIIDLIRFLSTSLTDHNCTYRY